MERTEVRNIVRAMCDYYPTSAPKSEKAMKELVDLWCLAISGFEYEQFQAALIAYVTTDTRGFFPTPGMLIQMLKTSEFLSESEAWSLVSKALRNGIYHAKEEFDALPEIVQRAVGSPDQLRAWAMDDSYNEGVAASLFGRTYNGEVQRMKRDAMIPPNILAITQQTVKQLEGKND